jgi:hypothetical protein
MSFSRHEQKNDMSFLDHRLVPIMGTGKWHERDREREERENPIRLDEAGILSSPSTNGKKSLEA